MKDDFDIEKLKQKTYGFDYDGMLDLEPEDGAEDRE
jgi:hypothetical protein